MDWSSNAIFRRGSAAMGDHIWFSIRNICLLLEKLFRNLSLRCIYWMIKVMIVYIIWSNVNKRISLVITFQIACTLQTQDKQKIALHHLLREIK